MKTSPLLSKPEFVSRFNIPFRPEYEAVVAKTVREYFLSLWPWASERQKEVYIQQDAEIWSILACPRAPEDRAEIGAEYILFYFAIDDLFDNMPHDKAIKAVAGIKGILLGDHPPRTAFEEIIHDLRSRMLSFGDNGTRELANIVFVHTVNYMEAAINHAGRRKVVEQGLDEYLKYRFNDAGFRFTTGVLAWELDLAPPPDRVLEDPDWNLLLSLSADQLILLNDMYSYRREAFGLGGESQNLDDTGDNVDLLDGKESYLFNAVRIILREDGVDEANVMDMLASQIHRRESAFVDTAEKLIERYKDHTDDLDIIQRWVAFLTDCMGGNHYWSTMCRRYNRLSTD